MEFKGKFERIERDFETSDVKITFSCKDLDKSSIDKIKDKTLKIKAVQYRQGRSLEANAYCWTLITKISDYMRVSKEEVYLDMLKHYGQSAIVSVISDIDVSPFFKYYEAIGEANLQGKDFIHYKVYKGSSDYDSREMSVLIDGVVHTAKQLGIETLTPKELEEIKERWKQ